ncbi:hypothetical protein BJX68DRAFT_233144 [Aspergillus pseudodeflectus]|uniref:Uncharacterized protein n=1 Tax=Aspergillus pseudodeflectus TaxID=176178 RepID=A0ABR4KMP0_9EURO
MVMVTERGLGRHRRAGSSRRRRIRRIRMRRSEMGMGIFSSMMTGISLGQTAMILPLPGWSPTFTRVLSRRFILIMR